MPIELIAWPLGQSGQGRTRPTFDTVSDPLRPLYSVGWQLMMFVSIVPFATIDPVAPVSKITSVLAGWVEVRLTGRLIISLVVDAAFGLELSSMLHVRS